MSLKAISNTPSPYHDRGLEMQLLRRRAANLEEENKRLLHRLQQLSDAIAFAGHEWGNQVLRLSLSSEKLLRQKRLFNAEQQQVIEELQHRVMEIRLSAHNYLSLSRIESSAIPLDLRPLELPSEVIQPVVESYGDLLLDRTVEIKIDSQPNAPRLVADLNLMKAVFDNLISNAIKYGEPQGRIVIGVRLTPWECRCNVWNSGVGLSDEQHIGRMFERFSHGKGPAIGESTGIGLYLVRQIVEAHHGKLWVETQFGAWADFIFALPHGLASA